MDFFDKKRYLEMDANRPKYLEKRVYNYKTNDKGEEFSLEEQFDGKLPITEDENGALYGEWTSAEFEMEQNKDSEIHLATRLAIVDAKTDLGGSHSKYKVNEDNMFVIAQPDFVAVGILDGAGGSKNAAGERVGGQMGSKVGSAVIAKNLREGRSPEEAIVAADSKIRDFAGGSIATGVLIYIENKEQPGAVTIISAGDCKAMTVRNSTSGNWEKFSDGTSTMQNVGERRFGGSPDYYIQTYWSAQITGGLGIPEKRLADMEKPEVKKFNALLGDIVIAGSDGFWDVVSEYEVEQLANECRGSTGLQKKLFELAYQRQNALEKFNIQHSKDETVEHIVNDVRTYEGETTVLNAGDNITIAVLELTPQY